MKLRLKQGGIVKLQNAAETIPTVIVADPMSQRISQNNHLAQIMERDAAKAEWERKVEAAEKKADERINNEDDNLASQFMFSGETGEWSRGANTNARRAKYVAEELGLDGDKAFLDSYKKDGKTGAIAFGTTLLTAPMAGEFATYGLLGGAARLAGGMAGSAVGSWGLGKVGDWADNRLGTNWMGTTGRIVGGFAGWSPGSNFAYKGALDLASKVPSIARIGATKQFIGDVAGRALGRSVSGTNLEISDLQRNIEAGKIGWAPTTTKTLWHNSEEPISQLKINFPAWDVVERNAPIGHVWLTGNETVQGFIGARPYHLKGKVKLNKPMVQIGEAVGDGKNITRNQILDFAQKSSADGINFQGIADNTLQNQDVYAVFKDVAVNPKLTIRERLGLSKGKYGSLDRFQKEALDDLDYAIERSNWILQYKDGKFFYGPKGSGENGIRKFSSLPSKTIFGSKDIDGTYVFYDNGNWSISNTDPSGYGGPNNDVSKSGNLIITSPKADAIDNGIEGIFPDTIDKNTMKSFWKANDQFIRPGTYVSGDAGQLPLGMQLKSDWDAMHEIGTIRNNNGDIKRVRSGTVDDILRHLYTKRPYKSGRTGLSVDSYMAILKQGNRPGHALRFSPDGFSIFNGQGIENKWLYDLHQQMLEGKIPQQQFVDAFNKWVEPYNGMKAVIKNGEVIIPHPFIRYKQGGNLKIKFSSHENN